jgi:hypothetical protein
MGEAKQRGTFEERRGQALEEAAARKEAVRAATVKAWNEMPEEEKEKYRNRRNGLRMMDSVIISMAVLGAMGRGGRS